MESISNVLIDQSVLKQGLVQIEAHHIASGRKVVYERLLDKITAEELEALREVELRSTLVTINAALEYYFVGGSYDLNYLRDSRMGRENMTIRSLFAEIRTNLEQARNQSNANDKQV